MTPPTLKQWQRRALKAEAENEIIQRCRQVTAGMEMQMASELAMCKVALKEAQDAINWALHDRTTNDK